MIWEWWRRLDAKDRFWLECVITLFFVDVSIVLLDPFWILLLLFWLLFWWLFWLLWVLFLIAMRLISCFDWFWVKWISMTTAMTQAPITAKMNTINMMVTTMLTSALMRSLRGSLVIYKRNSNDDIASTDHPRKSSSSILSPHWNLSDDDFSCDLRTAFAMRLPSFITAIKMISSSP